MGEIFNTEDVLTVRNILMSAVAAILVAYLVVFLRNQQSLWNKYKNIPGPTPFPLIGSAFLLLGLSFYECLQKLRDMRYTYGKMSRIWVGNTLCVSICHPVCIEKLCSIKIPFPRSQLFSLMGKPYFGDSIVISHGDIWRTHRKIISPTFYNNHLEKFVNVYSKNATVFADKLKVVADGNAVNIHSHVSLCTSDVIHDAILGTDLNAQVDNLLQYPQFSCDVMEILAARVGKPWQYPDFLYNMTKSGKTVENMFRYFRDYAQKALEYEKGNDQASLKPKSMIEILVENGELNEKEIVDESVSLVIAGIDTVATAFSFVMLVLGEHQGIQHKVMSEQLNIFGKDSQRPVSSEDLNSMIYLEQVIKETLRLYPPAPYLYRTVTQDMDLGNGYNVPKGTDAIVLIYDMHRDPELYPDPERFDPERFTPENSADRHPYAYIPFGAGRRMCIGHKFAMMELKALLSVVLRRYKIVETVSGLSAIQKSLEFGIILKPSIGYNIKILPRS